MDMMHKFLKTILLVAGLSFFPAVSVSETLIIERPISEIDFDDPTQISEVIIREACGNT